MKRRVVIWNAAMALVLALGLVFTTPPQPAQAVSPNLVISQFQVAGGSAADEFIEIHNNSANAVNIAGYKVVYRSVTGSTDVVLITIASGSIPAGGYYLVAHETGYDGGEKDAIFNLGSTGSLSGSSGGIGLRDPSGTLVDSVGYGSATNAFVETATTSVPAANASKARLGGGCTDTDNNNADFVLVNPSTPRNSKSPVQPCETAPSVVSTSPADGAVGVANAANLSVTFSEPVNVNGTWFSLVCGADSITSTVNTTDNITFTIDPDTDLPDGNCTGTVHAAQVSDQDSNDPPDNMANDYVFSFSVGAVPPAVSAVSPADGATNVKLDEPVRLTFNQEITAVSDGWAALNCGTSGSLSGTLLTALPASVLTLDYPNYAFGETCTLTVDLSKVTGLTAGTGSFTSSFSTLTAGTVAIRDIQGAGHISPKVGQAVSKVYGIVTAKSAKGFWMQDPNPDADVNTSEGIYIYTSSAPTVTVGQAVLVSGTVTEYRGDATTLTVTEITGPSVVAATNAPQPLPAPIVIGMGGRMPPTAVIEDDATGNVETSGVFDPANDGIDFYESLEGMRVQINNALVTKETHTLYGELPVVPDANAWATTINSRGGITLSEGDFNPEIIILDDTITGSMPDLAMGSYFTSPLIGVMDYTFGTYKFAISETGYTYNSITPVTAPASTRKDNQLTVGAYNIENFVQNPATDGGRYAVLANHIVNYLKSPDILALEEVIDDSGVTDDGVVTADVNIGKIVNAVVAAGGPTYSWVTINPTNDTDGGVTGGNIRQVILYNPARGVGFSANPAATPATTANAVLVDGGGKPYLQYNPGRLDPTNAAFNSSRKPLAAQFTFMGQTLFVISNHLNSKGGDDPLYGVRQPPLFSSEVQRIQQADIINAFVDQILAADPQANILVLGDLNDFQFSTPLRHLDGSYGGGTPVLFNLHTLLGHPEEIFTYTYYGNSQALDHIYASAHIYSGLAKPTSEEIIHLNAGRRFNTDPFRLSDHDVPLAFIDFTTYYSISGAVKDPAGAGVAGVTISLNSGESTTTAADGSYSFSGLLAGSYTVSAAKSGAVLSPASQSVTLGPDAANVNFTASFSISGAVLDSSSAPVAGVSVTAGGRTAVTDASGAYTLTGLPQGSFTVTPSLANVSFSPANRSVTLGPSATGVNFTAYYSISGSVLDSAGLPFAGVTVSDGAGHSAVTNSSGAYIITGLNAGVYTVSAALAGFTFSPASRSVTLGPSATGVNFTGFYAVSGVVKDVYGVPLAGVTVAIDRGPSAVTAEDGSYLIQNVPGGQQTVRASKAGYTFSPSAVTTTFTGSRTGMNFTAFSGSVVYLITPVSGAQIKYSLPVRARFDWYDVKGAASYRLTITGTGTTVYKYTYTARLSQASLPLLLKLRGAYQWKVEAFNAAGALIATSAQWPFSVVP